jgi:hypothetical protein
LLCLDEGEAGLASSTRSAKNTVEPKSGRCWMAPLPEAVVSRIHSAEESEEL